MPALTQDEPVLTSLALTHVRYNPSDPLSLISAYLALVPQALLISYTTLILSTREFEILYACTGQLLCEGLNYVLKRTFREPRPTELHGKGYGMPSSHAQFMAFWATYVVLFLTLRYRPEPESTPAIDSMLETQSSRANQSQAQTQAQLNSPQANQIQINHSATTKSTRDLKTTSPSTFPLSHALLATTATVLAGAVAQSRVYLSYHTSRQVVVGSLVGVACATSWFALGTYLRREGWIDWLLGWRLSQWLMVKDMVVECEGGIAGIGWAEWTRRRNRRTTARQQDSKTRRT